MESFLKLATTRRSIRRYKDGDVPIEDIEYFIKAAVHAPSGCNSQCWNFIAIKDKQIVKQIEEAVVNKVESILQIKQNELPPKYLSAKRKWVGFFTQASVVIAVFMTKVHHFDQIFISALKAHGYDDAEIMKLYANFDLLSIGASVQNMLLAIHEKGYGACWANDPAIAGTEIKKILNVPLEQRFISLVPIGIAAYTPKYKKMKDLSEVFTII